MVMFKQYASLALITLYGVSGHVIFEDSEKSAASFLRAKRSPSGWLTTFLGTTDAPGGGGGAVVTTPYVTTARANCRTLTPGQHLVIRNLGILETEKAHCYEQWEDYADRLEQNEGIKKGFPEEYKEVNKCVRNCRIAAGAIRAIGQCKKATNTFNSETARHKNGERNEAPKMKQFCKKCVRHVPVHYDAEDNHRGFRELVKGVKKVSKILGPVITGGGGNAGDLTVGGVNVQGALDEGLGLVSGWLGGSTILGGSDLSNGDQVCEGTHAAYDPSFFDEYFA